MDKICLICKKVFKKRINYSKKYWATAKYCSMNCAKAIIMKNWEKGHGFMKGKKLNITKEGMISKRFHSSGERNWNWQGGKSDIKRQIINLFEYRQWRSDVFSRDNWTCCGCGIRGGRLECHHIKAFSVILNQYNIQNTKQALDCDELWNINNGQTLCKECHKLTDNYSHKSVSIDKKTGRFTKNPEWNL